MTRIQGTMTSTGPETRTVFGLPSWIQPVTGFVVLFVLLVVVFWDFLSRQVKWAVTEQADWGHTLVIPFIAGYFVYLNRAKLFATSFRTSWSGLLPIVLGMAIYIFSLFGPQAFHHHNLKGFGAWLTLSGLVLLFLGWRSLAWLWFPLFYVLVFGQTMSYKLMNIITFRLQDITAVGSYFVLDTFLDVDRKGNTLYIFTNGELKPLNIAEACSGMRMLMAFFALGVAMAYTGLKRFWQQALLVLLAFPTAIIVNVMRVCTLGVLTLFDSGFAAGDFHSFVGLVWLLPAFLIYLGLMWIIRNLVIEDQNTSKSQDQNTTDHNHQTGNFFWLTQLRFDRYAKPAFVVACLTLVLCSAGLRGAVGMLNVYLKKEPISLRGSLSTIPKTVGPWKAEGDDQTYDAAVIEQLGTSHYLDRRYVRHGDGLSDEITVHIAYYTGIIDAVPHVPDRCLVAAGLKDTTEPRNLPLQVDQSQWTTDPKHVHKATSQSYRVLTVHDGFAGQEIPVRMPIGELRLRVTEFQNIDYPNLRIFSGYLFIANGQTTPSPDQVRLMAFNLTEKYAYYCKLQFTYGSFHATEEKFMMLASDILEEMLPEIMQRLPDWAELENRHSDSDV